MNNAKETLSSVRDVIPDIGGNFQLDPAVIESKKSSMEDPSERRSEAESPPSQNFQKEPKSCKQAVMEPHSGLGLLG
jgi:hypothetical protein